MCVRKVCITQMNTFMNFMTLKCYTIWYLNCAECEECVCLVDLSLFRVCGEAPFENTGSISFQLITRCGLPVAPYGFELICDMCVQWTIFTWLETEDKYFCTHAKVMHMEEEARNVRRARLADKIFIWIIQLSSWSLLYFLLSPATQPRRTI